MLDPNFAKPKFAPIAQLVEQIPLKDKVVGSIPTGRTNRELAGLCETERDGASPGRESFQQKTIPDHTNFIKPE